MMTESSVPWLDHSEMALCNGLYSPSTTMIKNIEFHHQCA